MSEFPDIETATTNLSDSIGESESGLVTKAVLQAMVPVIQIFLEDVRRLTEATERVAEATEIAAGIKVARN